MIRVMPWALWQFTIPFSLIFMHMQEMRTSSTTSSCNTAMIKYNFIVGKLWMAVRFILKQNEK